MNELHLTRKDFKVEYFSGSGAGGQHRNKCQNCCRIIHIATGIRAQCTEHRERHRNQEEAFKILAQRILEHYKGEETQQPSVNNTTIRTYHEPDNRVKDHVSGLQQPYSVVINDISKMIAARARVMNEQLSSQQ